MIRIGSGGISYYIYNKEQVLKKNRGTLMIRIGFGGISVYHTIIRIRSPKIPILSIKAPTLPVEQETSYL